MENIIKLLVVALVAISAILPASAASSKSRKKPSTIVTQEYVASIDCDACVRKVMNILPFQKGVKDVNVNLGHKIITVKYDARKCSDAAVIESLSKVDIDAKVSSGASSCCSAGCHSHSAKPISSKSR